MTVDPHQKKKKKTSLHAQSAWDEASLDIYKKRNDISTTFL